MSMIGKPGKPSVKLCRRLGSWDDRLPGVVSCGCEEGVDDEEELDDPSDLSIDASDELRDLLDSGTS